MTHKSPRVSPTLDDLLRRRPHGQQKHRAESPLRSRTGADAIGHPRRSPEALEDAILRSLADGPLMKWQIRQALHEPEAYVLTHLKALKRAGRVKVIGKVLDQRKWALTTWSEPVKAAPVAAIAAHVPATLGDLKPTIVPSKPKPPADSWWTTPRSREEFDQRAADRGREAGWLGRGLGDGR